MLLFLLCKSKPLTKGEQNVKYIISEIEKLQTIFALETKVLLKHFQGDKRRSEEDITLSEDKM